MGFLRRLLGRGDEDARSDGLPDDRDPDRVREADDGDGTAGTTEEERVRDRELLREDAERLSDPLLQRQLRYADRSWTPPRQGGERRADDRGAPES